MADMLRRFLPARFRKTSIRIPVVRLTGTIQAGGGALRRGLNLAAVAGQLEAAFQRKSSPAVALIINSPGGSPVQSRMIYQRIRALAEEHQKKVFAFVEDVAASGGYMIAIAADEIFVDPSSIVGSIGVVSGGFGFPELLKKIGVERRVYTAGENKALLDPFKPEREGDIAYLRQLQLDIHQTFISMVKDRRGARLADDPDLFSGLFWTGMKGVELGLVDGIGDLRSVLRARYGEKVQLRPVESKRDLFGRLKPGLDVKGAGLVAGELAEGLAHMAEDRALWARFGL